MSIYSLAAELGKAIKADERMIRMETAKEAYEKSEKINNLMMEYGIQQQALTTMGDGEEIDTDVQGGGYCAVCYEGVAMGGGKISSGKVKNHYPKGLRNNK